MIDRANIGRRKLLVGSCSALAIPALARAQGAINGAALVICNSKYHWEAQLPNVRRDAPDVARTFEALGLKTDLVLDATRDGMLRAIDKFRSAASGANLAALYFAGHGASWDNVDYLVPVDADLGNPGTTVTLVKSIEASAATKDAAHRLHVFDNCRNNPADGWRQLAAARSAYSNPDAQRNFLERSPNTLALFSTAPGHVAIDGPAGQNSPFAAAFMRQMQGTSVDLQSIPSKLRRDVLIATEGRQVMFDRNGFDQPFVVPRTGKAGPAPGVPAVDPSRVVELPRAYAYAQENGLPLPSGLVALRTPGKTADSLLIGSWAFTNTTSLGKSPGLMVVMSVDGRAAEIILSVKGNVDPRTGKLGAGVSWRFLTAEQSTNRIEFTPRDQGAQFSFRWRDENSGSLGMHNRDGTNTNNVNVANVGGSERFTRLDG